MEPVWNGLLTCDYEHTRPDGTLLEWDLYTRSLISWPRTLMDEPTPYGRLRRAGIVDIPEADHTRLVAQWHAFLADPEHGRDLIVRTDGHKQQTTRALDTADEALAVADTAAARVAVAEATCAFLAVNSTHIVNWLLPEQQWEDQLTQMFGDRAAARTCISALMTPSNPGHLLAARTEALAPSNLGDAAARLVVTVGAIYGPGSPAVAATSMESPAHVAELLHSTADGIESDELDTITLARRRATELRDTWCIAAVLAAAGDDQALRAVHAVAPLCQWAAESEERRKELRHRYMTTVRRWCIFTGVDPCLVTVNDLLT